MVPRQVFDLDDEQLEVLQEWIEGSQETFEALSGVPIADAQVAQALGHTPSRFAVWQCVLAHEALSVATELSRVAIVSRALRQVTIYLSFGSYRLYRTF